MPRHEEGHRWVQARVPASTHKRLRVAAAGAGVSMGAVLTYLIDNHLDEALETLTTA